jgi:hypothetical protein
MSAFLRDASPALKAALASGMVRYCANLITISLIDGETVYRWTDFDQALRYAGTRFAAAGQYLTRPTWNVKNTMEVPELSLKCSRPAVVPVAASICRPRSMMACSTVPASCCSGR